MKRTRLICNKNWDSLVRKWWVLLGLIVLGLAAQASPQIVRAARSPRPQMLTPASTRGQNNTSAASKVYLPFIRGGVWQGPAQPMLIGAYGPPGTYWASQTTINNYLLGLDSWAGLSRSANKGHSIAGDFKDIEDGNPSYNIGNSLELLWTNGYVAFMNMGSSRSAADIAAGNRDSNIRAWADAYKAWIDLGQSRRAFLAPLQEMNGDWTTYGCDPSNFKSAYQRIQTIFAQRGVARSRIWWAFAPNGWSSPCHQMSEYYPGDANVDVVAFSSYNQSCRTAWMTPQQIFGPYIDDIRTNVTSIKPIFIAQTASASAGGDKDQWIRDAYTYLLQQNIRGVLYTNGDNECDWAVYQPGGRQVQGYKDAVNSANIRYYPPATLAGLTFAP